MDIWIRVIQESQWGDDMWQRVHSHLTHLGPTGGMGREGEKERKERKRRESLEKRSSTFSLNFSTIGPMVSSETRDKVIPRDRSFAPRPESRSFDKL